MAAVTNCRACQGTGYCPSCEGVGQTLDKRDRYVRCETCGGSGTCRTCDGYGDRPDQRVRVVRINGRHSVIVWHGALKRVHANELEVCE